MLVSGILWVENGSTRHLLFKIILNLAWLMLKYSQLFYIMIFIDTQSYKVSGPCLLLSIFPNYAVGGVALRAGGEFAL